MELDCDELFDYLLMKTAILKKSPSLESYPSPSIHEDIIFSEKESSGMIYSPTSMIYSSSKEDEEDVDIICKNFKDFALISAQNGFKLSIEYEHENGTSIRLNQSYGSSNIRKVVQEMNLLLNIKREETLKEKEKFQTIDEKIERISVEMQKITKELSSNKEEMKQLELSMKEIYPSEMQNLQKPIRETKTQRESFLGLRVRFVKPDETMRTLAEKKISEPIKSSLSSTETFLLESSLTTVRIYPDLQKRICRMMEEVFLESDDEKKILLEYLNFLQTETEKTSSMMEKISGFFNKNRKLFWTRVSEEDMRRERERMMRKFGISVSGTIHTLSYFWKRFRFYMCLAIVNKKIVAWSTYSDKEDAMNSLDKILSTLWIGEFTFATQISGGNAYEKTSNTEVFKENEKVVEWIRRNFACLNSSLEGNHEGAFVAIYNMSLQFVEVLQEQEAC